MKTLGIDLAADPKKTGACAIDWSTGTVTLLPRPTTDEALVEAALDATRIGIDVPLGWPDAFVRSIAVHHDRAGWPPAAHPPPADRVPLRFRRTDLVLQARGMTPLSVSTDRIGVTSLRGARLQHLWSTAGIEVDRSGVTGRVVEAYPAGALRVWGLTSKGYKGTKADNRVRCTALTAELSARCGPLATTAAAALDGCDDDALDAFICALIARAAALGLTQRPEAEDLAAARREGWIHLPTVTLDDLIERT